MKICFITAIFGSYGFYRDLIDKIHDEKNWDIFYICSDEESIKNELPNYVNYYPVNIKRGSHISFNAIPQLYKIFKKEKFDLIQYSTTAALYSSIAGKLAHVPVRLYCHWGMDYPYYNGIKRFMLKEAERIMCCNSTIVEPVSYDDLYYLRREKLLNDTNSKVIGYGSCNGVDFSKFEINNKQIWRKEIRKKYEIDDTDFLIGFVGRIDEAKGFNELLTAFFNLNINNKKLIIVGPNDKMNTIDKELFEKSKKDTNVIYTGFVDEPEKYFSAMDVFVFPTHKEGFGNVLIEAAAMQVPVVVTNIPGPTLGYIRDKTVINIPINAPDSIIQAIQKIFDEPENSKKMGLLARKYVEEHFDRKELLEMIIEDRQELIMKAGIG